MSSDYLRHNRSLSDLESLIERDRGQAASLAKTELMGQVDAAIRRVEGTAEVATTTISAQTEVAVAQLTAHMEIASGRMLAETDRAMGAIGDKISGRPPNERAEVTNAMIAETAYAAQQELALTMKQSVEAIRRDAMRAIADIQKSATESIDEIRRFAEQTAATIDGNAEAAAARFLRIKADAATPEIMVHEAEKAARAILGAARTATALLKKTADDCVGRITAHAGHSEKKIADLAATAQDKMQAIHQRAVDRIAEIVLIRSTAR